MSDLNALRAKLQSLNTRNKKSDIWKPKDEHTVRFLPYPHGDDPFVVVFFHYDIGDGPLYCPKCNDGDDCEICDFSDKLKAWKTPDGVDKPKAEKETDWELFKKIQAKASVFAALIERGKESDGPKFVRLTPKQADKLLETCAEPQRLQVLGIDKSDARQYTRVLFDTKSAFDVSVKFAKPGEKGNGTTFNQTTYTATIIPSPLMSDAKASAEVVSKVKHMREVYPPMSAADVSKAFKKFVGAGMPEAKPEGGHEYGGKSPTNSDERPVTGGKSIDEALEKLEDLVG